jgi:hypothetical protein
MVGRGVEVSLQRLESEWEILLKEELHLQDGLLRHEVDFPTFLFQLHISLNVGDFGDDERRDEPETRPIPWGSTDVEDLEEES